MMWKCHLPRRHFEVKRAKMSKNDFQPVTTP